MLLSLVAFDDPGLDPKWFENPAWIILDHIWLRGVTNLSRRTNEGIEEEKAERLAALPTDPAPADVYISARDGVRMVNGGSEFIRPDGQGIRRNKHWKWVTLSDKRRLASGEEISACLLEEHREEPQIRHDAIITRQSRDSIGQLIEALRRYPPICLDAELDGERENVDIGGQGTPSAVASSNGAKKKKVDSGGAPRIPLNELVEMNHLQKHCNWEIADLADKFLDSEKEYVGRKRTISQRLYRARARGDLPKSEEACPHCQAEEWPDPPEPPIPEYLNPADRG